MNRIQQSAYESLAQVRSGGSDLGAICQSLRAFPQTVVAGTPVLETEDDADALALTENKTTKPLFISTRDGLRLPCLFTDRKLAETYAQELNESSNSVFRSAAWNAALYEILLRKYDGIVVDPGSEHEISLSRAQTSYLYALMNSEAFCSLPTLHVVADNSGILIQQAGERSLAYVYDSSLAAQAGLTRLQEVAGLSNSTIAVQELATRDVLTSVHNQGVGMLMIQAGLPDQHMYYRDDITRLLLSMGIHSAYNPEAQDEHVAAQHNDLLEAARQTSTIPPLSIAETNDIEVSNALLAMRAEIDQNTLSPWEFLSRFTTSLHVHVPLLAERSYGLLWPMFWRRKTGASFTATCFARRADMDREFSASGAIAYESYRLPGMEALRWIVATPAPFDLISIDCGDESPWLEIPAWWGLLPLFPLLAEHETIAGDPQFDWNSLNEKPHLGALSPNIWPQLCFHSAEFLDGSSGIQLSADTESTYVPVFSSAQQQAQFTASGATVALATSSLQGEHRIEQWLTASAGHAGIICNPGAQYPLRISRPEIALLLGLSRSTSIETRFDTLVDTARAAHTASLLDDMELGNLLARIPRYWICRLPSASDLDGDVLRTSQSESLALFTSQAKAEAFATANCTEDELSKLRIFPVLSGWENSAFHLNRDTGRSVCINPGSDELQLNEAALTAALEHLATLLMPRVPSFVDHD